MEKLYKRLLSTSKSVGNFYENVYSPVLQALPWLDKKDDLKTASEKVLGNLAFVAYDLSVYKERKEIRKTSKSLVHDSWNWNPFMRRCKTIYDHYSPWYQITKAHGKNFKK